MRQKLGQHFLKNRGILKRISVAAAVSHGDTVIEIGPGHGELTEEFLEIVGEKGRVIAIERDPELAEHIRGRFQDRPQFELREGDALKILPRVANKLGPYTLAGNIPYYLTGYLLRTVSELKNRPERTIFTIQKEVAERIMALPPDMNRLSAAVRFWSEPKIVGLISRRDFEPPPEVDSATILLVSKEPPIKSVAAYYKTMNLLFKQPRKTILNNLADGSNVPKATISAELTKLSIRPDFRPQDLDILNIVRIAKAFRRMLK